MEQWFRSLGPAGPCAVLFLGGILLIVGAVRKWTWLYPDHPDVRHYSTATRRILLFLIGITLIVAAVVFFIYQDHLSWGA